MKSNGTPYDMSGFLTKKRPHKTFGVVSFWQKTFFALDIEQEVLIYGKHRKKLDNPSGVIPLSQIKSVTKSDVRKGNGQRFDIMLKGNNRVFELKALTLLDRNNWVTRLSKCIVRNKPVTSSACKGKFWKRSQLEIVPEAGGMKTLEEILHEEKLMERQRKLRKLQEDENKTLKTQLKMHQKEVNLAVHNSKKTHKGTKKALESVTEFLPISSKSKLGLQAQKSSSFLRPNPLQSPQMNSTSSFQPVKNGYRPSISGMQARSISGISPRISVTQDRISVTQDRYLAEMKGRGLYDYMDDDDKEESPNGRESCIQGLAGASLPGLPSQNNHLISPPSQFGRALGTLDIWNPNYKSKKLPVITRSPSYNEKSEAKKMTSRIKKNEIISPSSATSGSTDCSPKFLSPKSPGLSPRIETLAKHAGLGAVKNPLMASLINSGSTEAKLNMISQKYESSRHRRSLTEDEEKNWGADSEKESASTSENQITMLLQSSNSNVRNNAGAAVGDLWDEMPGKRKSKAHSRNISGFNGDSLISP